MGKKKGPPPIPLRGETFADKKEAEKRHEEEEEFDEEFPDIPCVTLVSNDGYEFVVELRTAMISQRVRNIIYGGGNFEETETKRIQLPIGAVILERVIEYWHYRAQYSDHIDLLPKFDIDPKMAIELLKAADYLQT